MWVKMKLYQNMADSECFIVGSRISCTTVYNEKLEGEVAAFDIGTKLLIIKSNATSGNSNLHDMKLINLDYVKDVIVLADAKEQPPQLMPLNLAKLTSRIRQNVDSKKERVNHVGVGVSAEGQAVFDAIIKTIAETKWKGKNIIVMETVEITPPYGMENCHGPDGNQILNHVKKIVHKHMSKIDSQLPNNLRKSLSPSPSPATSS
ncbi:protein LSM12 homolog [Octopus sinensis]|nr:protein LSM12 homolog [Octopus sinensis]XP_036362642.1 protein LSM12 homolog [Octopus sinensis]